MANYDSSHTGAVIDAAVTSVVAVDPVTTATSNLGLGSTALDSLSATNGNYNVAVGVNAATALTTGDDNIAVGYAALDAMVTGERNIAIGSDALGGMTDTGGSCDDNIAIGNDALLVAGASSNVSHSNISIGSDAGKALSTGDENVFIGKGAGVTTTDVDGAVIIGQGAGAADMTSGADGTIAIGYAAGAALTTSAGNTIIGYQAADAIDAKADDNIIIGAGAAGALDLGSGDSAFDKNIAIGIDALKGEDWGSTAKSQNRNIAIGYHAMDQVGICTAVDNIFIGYNAGGGDWNTTESNYNVGIGSGVMDAVMDGALGNVSVGYSSAGGITSGDSNTCVGYGAGFNITTGGANTCIGVEAGQAVSPSGSITTANDTICFGNTNVSAVYVETDAWTTSDIRDKADVADFNGGLDWINAMQPISYVWDKRAWYCEKSEDEDEDGNPISITPQDILDAEPDGTHKKSSVEVGFSAQAILELEQSLGYGSSNDTSLLVDLTHDGTKYSLKRSHMIPMMVNAIKELSAKVEALENE